MGFFLDKILVYLFDWFCGIVVHYFRCVVTGWFIFEVFFLSNREV